MLKILLKIIVPLIVLLILVKFFFPSYFDMFNSLINLILGVILVYAASQVEIEEMRSSTEKEIEAIKEINKKIEANLGGMVKELSIIATRLNKISISMEHVEKALTKTTKEYTDKKRKLEETERRLEEERTKIEELTNKMNIGVYFTKYHLFKYKLNIFNKGLNIKDVNITLRLSKDKEMKTLSFKCAELDIGETRAFKLNVNPLSFDNFAITITYKDSSNSIKEITFAGNIKLNYIYGLEQYISTKNTLFEYILYLLLILFILFLYMKSA